MSDERQKKIESGKLKLAKFQRKLSAKKGSLKGSAEDSSFQFSSLKDVEDKSEATDSSSNTSINTMKEKSETSLEEAMMDSSPIEESAFTTPEDVIDDTDAFHTGETELVSCLEQKLLKYQNAGKQKDEMIKQLSQQLASSVNKSEAESELRTETIEKLKEEINMLHLQMKETASMIEKQNSKSNGKESLQGFVSDLVPCCEIGIQVSNVSDVEEINVSNIPETSTSSGMGDMVCNKDQQKTPSDVFSVIKKIDSLAVITRLIESVTNISTVQSINDSSDFSPSKFQSLFLKRLNSVESDVTQIDTNVLENESLVSEINYSDAAESFVKDRSLEKLSCRIAPQNLSLITEFLYNEMENINSSLFTLKNGPRGDGDNYIDESMSFRSFSDAEGLSEKSLNNLNFEDILRQKSKLEAKILYLRQLQNNLKDNSLEKGQLSVDPDVFSNSDDNLIMEEPPLSCVSLLSLTDSEYRNDFITTDSEANFSRKVSLDSSKPAYDRDFCPKCDKYFELVKDKYDDHLCLLKESVENNLNFEKNEAVKKLVLEIEELKIEKDNIQEQMTKQIELLCQEQEMKVQQMIDEHQKQMSEIQERQNSWMFEEDKLTKNVSELQKMLHEAHNEKTKREISHQKQIADLVEEHEKDLEARILLSSEQLSQERKKFELDNLASLNAQKKLHENELEKLKKSYEEELSELYKASEELKKLHSAELDGMKKSHVEEIEEIKKHHQKDFNECKMSHTKELEELKKIHATELENIELHLKKEHSESISLIEANHSEECATYQKKIEKLLEEKCDLLNKNTQEYENILKKNHKVLVKLCNQLRSRISVHRKRIFDESVLSQNSDLDTSIADTLDVLNKSIENGLVKFLERNYFTEGDMQELFEETQYLELKSQFSDDNLPHFNMPIPRKERIQKVDVAIQHNNHENSIDKVCASEGSSSSISLDAEDIDLIHAKTIKLQEDFQKDISTYMEVNEQLRSEKREIEQQVKQLETQLLEKDKELAEKESQLSSVDNGSVNYVSQTNSRLIHVLSDYVKTFLDIESEINHYLHERGLIPSPSGASGHQDEDTAVGSREDFASLSFSECPNLELQEDGPYLTPRTWDLLSSGGNYDHEMEGEDVVLVASRRLRQAVDRALNCLTQALENNQNEDLKMLLKRNEEISQELKDETKARDEVHLQLIAADGNLRKLENEKQKLQYAIADLTESNDMLKREVTIERNTVAYLKQEKEAANDEIQTLKNQCEMLASRLGDPEKKLLQENSRLSSEKHNVQINFSKERQSLTDKLQQIEMALEDLTAEKEQIVEQKCKEIRDMKAEMGSMEKQLQSHKKFIEEQAQEREQEREEYLKELNKMQETVREKEKIQSNEAQLLKEIESLEQTLRAKMEDHQQTRHKKDAIENELRQHVDKIRDLREVIEEQDRQLNIKSKIENELRLKLSYLTETVNASERRNSILDDELAQSRVISPSGESTEQVQNLKERLAFQSQEIEEMSQNKTLLQELRGQIHFLEAKVEQRIKQLETSFLSSGSPILSSDASPSSSHESETMHLPCEDGWEMSPRSIHWLEVRRLEEKFGRLIHIDEELIKKNKELEAKLKRLQLLHDECELENNTLQKKLSEQIMQVSALKSHIEEQKHGPATPHKSHILRKQIEELKEAYETAVEKNDQLLSELDERCNEIHSIREELAKTNYALASQEKATRAATIEKEEIEKSKKQVEKELSSFKSAVVEKDEELKKNVELVEKLQDQVKKLRGKSTFSSVLPENETEMDKKNEMIKNLEEENANLKELLENSQEQVDSEQGQKEALFEQIATLSQENKKLEEDLDSLHCMMQQKENELHTLHEETDAQIKLEAELVALENELTAQKSIENDLRDEVKNLESALETLNIENEHLKSCNRGLGESQHLEIINLKKQLEVYKKNVSADSSEDIDFATLQTKILEASKSFKFENPSDSSEYADLVYLMLKKAVDNKLMQLRKEYETNVNHVNDTWQRKVQKEYVDRKKFEFLDKKYCALQEKVEKDTATKDSYWQSQLQELEKRLEEKHSKELELTEENNQLNVKVGMFTQQVEKLSKNLKVQKEKMVKEFQLKVTALKQKLEESYEKKLKSHEVKFQNKLEKAKFEFDKLLEQERQKLGQEKAQLQEMYHMQWNNEMQKFIASQLEHLKKYNSNKEVNLKAMYDQMSSQYAEKLTKIQQECQSLMADERRAALAKHKEELQKVRLDLQNQFDEEKKGILLTKEREMSSLASALEERMAEISQLKAALSTVNVNTWEEEKANLIASHRKELNELRCKYERMSQNCLDAHDRDIKNVEKVCNQRLEELNEMLRVAKCAASRNALSDSGSCRTATPSSEINSSDETCSSCRDELLLGNKQLLVNKLHQEGKRILNLIESTGLTSAVEKEAFAYLEERAYVVGKLRLLKEDSDSNSISLKVLIDEVCEEVLRARQLISNHNQELSSLRTKCADLQNIITDNSSKICILANNFSRQKDLNAELELQLTTRTNEIYELRKTIEESNRLNENSTMDSARNGTQLQFINSSSSSYDVGKLRSAGTTKSAENFSPFLPEIGNSSFVKLNRTEEIYPETVKPLLELTSEILASPEDIERPESIASLSTQRSNIPQQLSDTLTQEGLKSSYDAKIHRLYWAYRRSLGRNRGLIYQKRYLLMLLKGYQMTEKYAMIQITQMEKCISCDHCGLTSTTSLNSSAQTQIRGRALFKSAVYVVIAIQRMKYYVRKWSLLATVPASNTVKKEVQSVFHKTSPLFASNSHKISHQSLSSRSASICDSEKICTGFNSSSSSTSSRSGTRSKRKSKPNKDQLIEYVQRLDNLQKQLGLDNLR